MKIFDEIKERRKDLLVVVPIICTRVEPVLDQYLLAAKEGLLNTDRQRKFRQQIDLLPPHISCFDVEKFRKAVGRFETMVRNAALYWDMEKDYIGMAEVREWELTPSPVISIYLPIEQEELDHILQANDLESCVICDIKCEMIKDREILFGMMRGSIREVNYLLYSISKMDQKQRTIFEIACGLYTPLCMKDMINLAANIDGFVFYDVKSMKELGEYLLNFDLFDYAFEEAAIQFLDPEKVAEWHIRFNQYQCLFRGGYVENTRLPEQMIEIYDGINLPSFSISGDQKQTADQTMNL